MIKQTIDGLRFVLGPSSSAMPAMLKTRMPTNNVFGSCCLMHIEMLLVVPYSLQCFSLSHTVHLKGFCDGRMFDCRDVAFTVGEGEDHDIPIGIDKALEKMQRGEHCILHIGTR